MKKLLAAIVAVAMILSLAVVPAMAETRDPHATFVGDTCEGEPGDTVDYTVTIDGAYEFHGLTMEINYNSDILTLNSYTLGSVLTALPTGAMAMPDNSIPGSFRLGVMCAMDGITATGEMITLNFTIADDVDFSGAEGPVPHIITPVEFVITAFTYMPINEDPTDIEYETEDGSVVIYQPEVPPTEVPPTEVPPTEFPPTEVPPTEVPPTEVPPTEVPEEPTPVPEEPTEVPEEPTEVPEEPTEVPPTDEPTPVPPTGAIALVGVGIAAIAAGAGVVIFRKKED